jgi:8-oxo-dGTP pyrophosphatase MutT (NUDIX family)
VHRRPLLDLLAAYGDVWPDDRAVVERVVSFVEARPDCLERTCLEGHVTGSAWVISRDGRLCLLTNHKKLGFWLQLGGHADGDPDIRRVAVREVEEESGLEGLRVLSVLGRDVPLDLDVHPIPATPREPAHFHYDVRFLIMADDAQPLVRSEESNDLGWFTSDALRRLTGEESVLRLERRARAVWESQK